MAAQNINRVIITGNLTRDPETRTLGGSSTSVTSLRVAVNGRRKDNTSGQWVDKPNYFDVTVWGAAGENAARYLSKGRGVAIDGRLDWREWQDQQGNKRQSVEIVADNVQFLSDGSTGGGDRGGYQQSGGYGGEQPAYAGGGGGDRGGYERAGAPAGGGGGYGGDRPREAAPAEGGYDRGGYERQAAPAVDRSDFAPARSGAGLPDPGEDDIPF